MKSEFMLAFNQICSERSLSRQVVLEALEVALTSAYRRNVNAPPAQNVTARIDQETGQATIYVEKEVVETVEDEQTQVALSRARKAQPGAQVGDQVMIESTPRDFGRIAAQTAKQVILQRIREAERDAQYAHYVEQEGEIVHGTVQSISPQGITIHLERTEAVMPRQHQVPGERYSLHQRIRAYVLEVKKTGRGPQVIVSRSHKKMLQRLLELEVPEIFNGAVEIKSIAREAGSRSKIAVAARQPGVDPVGACVGQRGVRIQSIVNELGGEKIDVIEWDSDPAQFIAKALSPARVLSVMTEEHPSEGRTASVVVPDDQLSLAIGRSGQNARLAAKLTGWRIDIQSATEAAAWALKQVNDDPDVVAALGGAAEQLPTLASILRIHKRDELPYNTEELLTIRQVVEALRRHYASKRGAEKSRLAAEDKARREALDAAQAERRAAVAAARSNIPTEAFNISLDEVNVSPRVLGHLNRADMRTVGDLLNKLAEGDEGLLKFEGIGPKSLGEIKAALDQLGLASGKETAVAGEVVEAQELPLVEAEEELVETAAAELVAEPMVEEVVSEPVAEVVIVEAVEEGVEEGVKEGEGVATLAVEPVEESATQVTQVDEQAVEAVAVAAPVAEPPELPQVEMDYVAVYEFEGGEEEELDASGKGGKKKKGRKQHRELVFDEDLGATVARKKRKGGRARGDWEDLL